MALSETKKVLINGLSLILKSKDTILVIALMLKSEAQMLTMIDWINKHQKENLNEDLVLQVAEAIKEQVK